MEKLVFQSVFFRRRALAALGLRQIFLGGHPCVFFENMAEIGGVLEADALRDWLTVKHPQVNIIDFDFYNTEVFNSCENDNNLLMAVPTWRDVHPLLKIIPVDWDFTMPFGLLHSPQPAPHVQKCINAITRIYRENRA